MADKFKCSYCGFYAASSSSGEPTGLPVFTGTYQEVLAHADEHPVGAPEDMVVANR